MRRPFFDLFAKYTRWSFAITFRAFLFALKMYLIFTVLIRMLPEDRRMDVKIHKAGLVLLFCEFIIVLPILFN